MKKMMIFALAASLVLGACSSFNGGSSGQPAKRDIGSNCPDGIIEWVPLVMWDDVKYQLKYDAKDLHVERGEKIGEVEFKMSDVACSNYKMVNGDAAFAEIGTPIYSVKGYSEKFRVLVGEKLYEVESNPHAKTIGDLYGIEGMVKKVSVQSPVDNSFLYDFSAEGAQQFIKEFMMLKYIGYDRLHQEVKPNNNRLFLRIGLTDGSHIQTVYWPDQNAFGAGALGNQAIKDIVMKEKR